MGFGIYANKTATKQIFNSVTCECDFGTFPAHTCKWREISMRFDSKASGVSLEKYGNFNDFHAKHVSSKC